MSAMQQGFLLWRVVNICHWTVGRDR